MNRIVMGFEKDTLTDVQREAAAYFDQYSSGITLPNTGRRGTQCLRLKGGQWMDFALPTTEPELFVGLAFLSEGVANTGTANGEFLRIYSSANSSFYISWYIDAGRRLAAVVNTGSSITWQSTTPIAAGGWYHLGIHQLRDVSAGILAAYFDGAATPDTAASNGKTADASWGSNVLNTMRLRGPGTTNDGTAHRFGDVYVNDGSDADGLGNDGLWGDMKITGRFLAANGSNMGLSRSSGTDDAALLNDASDASYLYGTAAKTTLTTTALGFTATNIKTRAVKFIADKEDATARTLDCVTRVGGVDYDGGSPAALAAANPRRYVFLQPLNPATSAAWAQAALEASELGPKIA